MPYIIGVQFIVSIYNYLPSIYNYSSYTSQRLACPVPQALPAQWPRRLPGPALSLISADGVATMGLRVRSGVVHTV